LAPGATGSIDAEVGDARELDFADASIDAVLLLGPIHHLIRRRDRLAALAEARRVVRPGGPVFIAAISRWAPLLHGILVKRTDLNYPEARDLVKRVIRTGVLPPLFPGDFTAYVHRPNQLRAEVRAAGLELIDLVSVEGLAFALPANDSDIELLIDAARQTERIPELMGLSQHMLLTARRGVTPC
ncbi:MAG: class I SAM-dependent methyltransferase, partial [Streptosporangiaceae bacterium]